MKKLILKVSALTMLAIILLVGILYGVFTIFAPHLLGSLCENLGMKGSSLYFYEKEYNKNSNTSNLYRILNKSIIFEDNERVIKYFEKFYALDEYEMNIETINKANYDEKATVLENISLSNADNRLKTRYVKALATKGEFVKAFDFAVKDLKESGTGAIADMDGNINFVFAGLVDFLNTENGKMFDSEKIGTTTTVADAIYNYYSNLKTMYLSIKDSASDFILGNYANKMLVITDFMFEVDKYTQSENYSAEKISNANTFADGLKRDLVLYLG